MRVVLLVWLGAPRKPVTKKEALYSVLFLYIDNSLRSTSFVYLSIKPQVLVSRKPRNLFGPVKPFLVQLYLKMEKCIRLKCLV